MQTKLAILASVLGTIAGLCLLTSQNILISILFTLSAAGIGLVAFLSKDKKDQLIEELHNMVSNDIKIDYLSEAVKAHKEKGTPRYYIDTLDHLNLEEKAKLYDDSVLASRGRAAKNNPYIT
jgi:hypothetical protein